MILIKISPLRLYRARVAVCSKVQTKHTNTLCGQNVELSVPRSKHTPSQLYVQTNQLMLYSEIIAVCSEIHTKHINTVRTAQ
jgi:hypothetical protein